MSKKILTGMMIILVSICFCGMGFAGDKEILGVTFPGEKVIAGKTLKLNGVAYRKALGIVKVFVCGLYLEKNTNDAKEGHRIRAGQVFADPLSDEQSHRKKT